ncbi:coiled-coil domain-containing protein 86 [Sigmodon hispidus]
MDTPRRCSRRLEGLKPQFLKTLPDHAVSRARRALVEFESNTQKRNKPKSLRVQPPSLASPRPRPETSPGSPCLEQDAGIGSSQRQPKPDSGSLQPQRDLGLESPTGQAKPSLESSQREESSRFSSTSADLDSEVVKAKEALIPGSPEPCPRGSKHRVPNPLSHFPEHQQEPSRLPLGGEPVTGGFDIKKRITSSPQAPVPKKLKEELPVIPKGKPKSGHVWKDRSKKRFSQMVQDKPLHTSWQRKMKERQDRKLTKDFARHLEEEKQRRRQEKKERRAENLKHHLENERKAEIVQVIRNPAKLKKAKKRDTLALLQKQPPQRPVAKV